MKTHNSFVDKKVLELLAFARSTSTFGDEQTRTEIIKSLEQFRDSIKVIYK